MSFVLALLGCDGPAEIGSTCRAGAEDACVAGAVCTPDRSESDEAPEDPNSDTSTCRAECDVQADCEEGFECRRASGSMLSSCQPDDDEGPSADGGA